MSEYKPLVISFQQNPIGGFSPLNIEETKLKDYKVNHTNKSHHYIQIPFKSIGTEVFTFSHSCDLESKSSFS